MLMNSFPALRKECKQTIHTKNETILIVYLYDIHVYFKEFIFTVQKFIKKINYNFFHFARYFQQNKRIFSTI